MAIEEEVDALVLAGDLLIVRVPSSKKIVLQSVESLQHHLNSVVVALGNHDAGTSYVSEGAYLYFGSAVETIEVETRNGERVAQWA